MVTLPETAWGTGDRRALLLHGINGDAGVWWRIGQRLADSGWTATAVDLRGHGTAPRTADYRLADYVDDLPGSGWDLVIGHSLGAAIGVVAATRRGFARRLVLLDPVLRIEDDAHDAIHREQADELSDTLESIRAARPLWHPTDVERKVAASRLADAGMIEGTFTQNRPWDILAEARTLTIPTLVIGADLGVGSTFPIAHERDIPATTVRIEGAGHSPHRDRPEATIAALERWLTSEGVVPL